MEARSALWQPREPAMWAFLGLVVATALIALAEQAVFREISPSGWTLAWILVLIYAAPVLLLVSSLDLLEGQPPAVLAAAFVWGAIPATTLSAVANAGWGMAVARAAGPEAAANWTAAVTAPGVEETLKLAGMVLLCLLVRRAFSDLLDGFVVGVMVGLGFSVVEDVFYFMGVFGGQPMDVIQGFFMRAVASGFYGHLLYSGLAGIGLAYFVTERGHRSVGRRMAVAGGLFLAAVGLHFLWNTPWLDFFPRRPWTGTDLFMLPVALVVKGVPFLAIVALSIGLARSRQRRWLARAEEEPDAVALSRADRASLASGRMRRHEYRVMRKRAGPVAARMLRRLRREQRRLVMLWGRGQDAAIAAQRAECRSLRDALNTIPGAAPAGG